MAHPGDPFSASNQLPMRKALRWSYRLPFGKGLRYSLNGFRDTAFGGWIISGIAEFMTGVQQTVMDLDNSGTGNLPAGGNSTLILRDGSLVNIIPSIGGTMTNCAGGVTPWETWLTCEENTTDRTAVGGKKHGYVFEVSANPEETTAQPLVAMGRFRHEAVSIDPTTNFCYQTEDQSRASLLYRFEPDNDSGVFNSYADGGKLKAARVKAIVSSCSSSTRSRKARSRSSCSLTKRTP